MPYQPPASMSPAIAGAAAGVAAADAARIARALGGDRTALARLLERAVAAGTALPRSAGDSPAETAARMQRLADRVAACYTRQQAPSDRDCDEAFAVALAVDALAVSPLPQSTAVSASAVDDLALEVRHAARAHAAELAAAARASRPVAPADALAADRLYALVRDLGRFAQARPADRSD